MDPIEEALDLFDARFVLEDKCHEWQLALCNGLPLVERVRQSDTIEQDPDLRHLARCKYEKGRSRFAGLHLYRVVFFTVCIEHRLVNMTS